MLPTWTAFPNLRPITAIISRPHYLLWGRHDPYYQIDEVFAYARDLDRIDMHIYDGAHLLLKTHHQECSTLMRNFIINVQSDKTEL